MGQLLTCCRHCCSMSSKVLLDDDSGRALFLYLESSDAESIVSTGGSRIAASALLTAVEYHNALQTTDGLPLEAVQCVHNIQVIGLGSSTWGGALRYVRVDATFARPNCHLNSSKRRPPMLKNEPTTYFIYRDTPPDIIHYTSSSTGFAAVKGLDVPEYGL